MPRWQIEQQTTGVVLGEYPGATEEEALVAYLRDAGYGPDQVWLEDGGVSFLDDDTGELLKDSSVIVTATVRL